MDSHLGVPGWGIYSPNSGWASRPLREFELEILIEVHRLMGRTEFRT